MFDAIYYYLLYLGTIDGENFLENPLKRPDVVNYDFKRSVSIATPKRSRSRFDQYSDPTRGLEPYSSFENSAKRHELEVLTK